MALPTDASGYQTPNSGLEHFMAPCSRCGEDTELYLNTLQYA